MNLKILFMLLIYYSFISIFFALGGAVLTNEGFSTNVDLNATDITSEEIDTGGIFGTGVSFVRFAVMVLFGIGLPSGTPSWFAIMFASWQTLVTIFSVGFIVSSVWDG